MIPRNVRTPGNKTTVELFDYPPIDDSPMLSWEAFGFDVISDCRAATRDKDNAAAMSPAENEPPARNEAEESHSQEFNQSFEAGRLRGREEGQIAEREAAAATAKAREKSWIEQTAKLMESFDAQRKQYFETAEREVVQLALAVAARILRRESQMDPLLLSGAVRVALGQLSSTTQVRLRVPGADLELWRQTIAHLPNPNVKPAVTADGKMRPGECVLECDLGSVDLGIVSQLAEIEREFLGRSGVNHAFAETIAVEEDMTE